MTLTNVTTLTDALTAMQPLWEEKHERFTLRAPTATLTRFFGPDAARRSWQPAVYWDWATKPESYRWDSVVTDFGTVALIYDDTLPPGTVVIQQDT